MIVTRRDAFLSSLAVALGIDQTRSRGTSNPDLIWMLDTFGEQAVAEAVAASIDMTALLKRLRRSERPVRRQADKRRRRERAEADTVLYRGPIEWGDLHRGNWREVRNQYHRRVQIADLPEAYRVGDHVLPRGSRLIVDTRQGIPDLPMGEIIRTAQGAIRVHLWGNTRKQPSNGLGFKRTRDGLDDQWDIQEALGGHN